jgi:hypothetical protein
MSQMCYSVTLCQKVKKYIVKKVVKKLSKSCQKVVRKLSKICQKVNFKQLVISSLNFDSYPDRTIHVGHQEYTRERHIRKERYKRIMQLFVVQPEGTHVRKQDV